MYGRRAWKTDNRIWNEANLMLIFNLSYSLKVGSHVQLICSKTLNLVQFFLLLLQKNLIAFQNAATLVSQPLFLSLPGKGREVLLCLAAVRMGPHVELKCSSSTISLVKILLLMLVSQSLMFKLVKKYSHLAAC